MSADSIKAQKNFATKQGFQFQLLSNPEKVNKLTTNGYNFVKKNLTWDVMLPKFIQFYENLLNN